MTMQDRLAEGGVLVGTFVKTPSAEIIEILSLGGLDFICLDTEHSAWGRRELDWALALARALGLPALVRVAKADSATILQALDAGAAGVVVPHVDSAAKAREVARLAHFGEGGRGYAGSTRAARFTTMGMGDVLSRAAKEVFVIAQIEDPPALGEIDAIAATPGIDALFFGGADMAVGLGLSEPGGPAVSAAFGQVACAARAAGKTLAAYCAGGPAIAATAARGVSLIFAGSDQGMVLAGARTLAAAPRG